MASASTIATPNSIESTVKAGSEVHHQSVIQSFGVYSSRDHQDLKLAWDIINDEESWKDGTEKENVLKRELGIKGPKDLTYMQEQDVQLIMGKLLTIPARRLATAWGTSTLSH